MALQTVVVGNCWNLFVNVTMLFFFVMEVLNVISVNSKCKVFWQANNIVLCSILSCLPKL